jgi:signal transduction histidine kinase
VVVCTDRFAAWLLGSFRSGLVAVDAEGAVAAFNAEARRILECPDGPPESALARDCRDVLAPHPVLVRVLLDGLDGRERPSRAELVLRSGADRAPRTLGFTLLPVRDAEDRVRGAALLFRDLTPYERSEEQDRLRDRLAALGEMAAGLAHEIRNPLAGMEVLAGLLRRRLRDRPAECELLDELTGELRRLAATVTASLEFVRPPALAREPVDAIKLLDESLGRARARVPFTGSIERCFPPAVPGFDADPEAMRSVFTNLIVNAFEAMGALSRAGGHRLRLGVDVRLGEPPARSLRVEEGTLPTATPVPAARELVVSVTDTGPGIPDEIRDRIFYPFFTTKERGVGIGLATVQRLVGGHGGRLELDSRPGSGTTFRVRLPLDDGPTP